nr:MAG TPA: hypothetical protein [Caudoviricetes sp.]
MVSLFRKITIPKARAAGSFSTVQFGLQYF